MSRKKKILQLLKKAIDTEEQIIPIYANHCRVFAEYLDLDESTRNQFIDVFSRLKKESHQHRELLDRLFQSVEKAI